MALIETDPFGGKQQFDQGDGRCIRCGQAVCLPVQALERLLVQLDGSNIGQSESYWPSIYVRHQ